MAQSALTKCRLAMRKLIKAQGKLYTVLLGKPALVKGTVYEMKTTCGNPNCRCNTKGKLHRAWRITRSHRGRTQSRSIARGAVKEYKRLTGNYRRFREARAELAKINRQILELVNGIEEGRKREPKEFKRGKRG